MAKRAQVAIQVVYHNRGAHIVVRLKDRERPVSQFIAMGKKMILEAEKREAKYAEAKSRGST